MPLHRRFTPAMVVGAAVAAFLSQASSGNAATVTATSTVTAAPSLFCTQAADGISGDPQFVCSADGLGGTARGYWDGLEPAVDLPLYSAVRSETGGDATVTVSANAAALVIASSNAVASAIANASSTAEVYASSGSTVTATSGGQSTVGAQASTNSDADVVATQFSRAVVDIAGGSSLTAYVSENSTGAFGLRDGSQLTAYAIDRSVIDARLLNESQAVLAAGGGSQIAARLDDSTFSALATNASIIAGELTEGSDATVKADGRSLVSTRAVRNSVVLVRAADGALVVAGAADGSDTYVDAYGGVEAIGEAIDGADVEVTAADGSVVHAGAIGANASVKTAAVADALLEATSDNATVEALSVGGYNWSQAFDNSAIFTRSFGYGAEAYSEALEGALVVTQADSGADPAASARVLGSATGNVYVNAEANGDGARAGIVAGQLIPGSLVGPQARVTGLAYDGAEVSVDAQYVAGDVIVAAASGAGSRAFIVVDHSTGTGPVTITVLATEGGTAYIFEDTNEFGCFGGVTSVKTSAGGCESNGNVTIITYADGSTATFTDLVAPADLVASVDISNPFPTIERVLEYPEVNPGLSNRSVSATSSVESPAVDSFEEEEITVGTESEFDSTAEVSDGGTSEASAPGEGVGVDAAESVDTESAGTDVTESVVVDAAVDDASTVSAGDATETVDEPAGDTDADESAATGTDS